MTSDGSYRPRRRRMDGVMFEYASRRRERRAMRLREAGEGRTPRRSVAATFNLARFTDHEVLLTKFRQLRRSRAKAPGRDGVRFDDLGHAEAASVMRDLAEQIAAGRFVPQDPLLVQIPKRPGPGTRTLALPDLLSHVIAASITEALTPLVDPFFVDTSFGFRPRRGTQDMLARLFVRAEHSRAMILINDDVRDAFGRLPVGRIAELLADLQIEQRLIELMLSLVTAGRVDRQVGLNQGSELSPILMNLLLHQALDVPFQLQAAGLSLCRYADNLAVLCNDRSEADRCYFQLVELLAAVGLELKGEDQPEGGIFDLTRQSTTLLGFQLERRNERIVFQLSEPAETLVTGNLEELVRIEARPEECVKDHLLGWIGSLGPAYQDTDVETVCATALSVAASFGFRTIVPPEELHEKWRRAHQGWLTRLSRVRSGEIPLGIQVQG